jgi:hypothetical protein
METFRTAIVSGDPEGVIAAMVITPSLIYDPAIVKHFCNAVAAEQMDIVEVLLSTPAVQRAVRESPKMQANLKDLGSMTIFQMMPRTPIPAVPMLKVKEGIFGRICSCEDERQLPSDIQVREMVRKFVPSLTWGHLLELVAGTKYIQVLGQQDGPNTETYSVLVLRPTASLNPYTRSIIEKRLGKSVIVESGRANSMEPTAFFTAFPFVKNATGQVIGFDLHPSRMVEMNGPGSAIPWDRYTYTCPKCERHLYDCPGHHFDPIIFTPPSVPDMEEVD